MLRNGIDFLAQVSVHNVSCYCIKKAYVINGKKKRGILFSPRGGRENSTENKITTVQVLKLGFSHSNLAIV